VKVLLLSDWMTSRGGAERYIVSLRDGLRAASDETTLVGCSAAEVADGSCDHVVYGSDFPPAQAFLQIANPIAGYRLRSIVRAFNPDVAVVSQFAYHFSPSVFGPLSRTPVVVAMMDYKAICPLGTRMLPDGSRCLEHAGVSCRHNRCLNVPHWIRDQPRYSRIRSVLMRADRIVCPSSWMKEQFAAAGIDADVVALGVPEPATGFAHTPSPHPLFVYCGRLSSEKGVSLLVRAFANFVRDVPHAALRIVGDGPQRAEIDDLIKTLDVERSVTITGWVSPDDVDREMRDAWALVAPSIWAEPFGLAVVEAMMRGIPVIVSDSGAFLETVEQNATGLFFESGNEAALVQALRKIAMRTIFPSGGISAESAAAVRARFRMEDHIDRMRSVFREVAGLASAYA
jgi:glycosyltransferase involved in cell wall biosynthesis